MAHIVKLTNMILIWQFLIIPRNSKNEQRKYAHLFYRKLTAATCNCKKVKHSLIYLSKQLHLTNIRSKLIMYYIKMLQFM